MTEDILLLHEEWMLGSRLTMLLYCMRKSKRTKKGFV